MDKEKYDYYEVSINQPGFLLLINNKLSRTPLKTKVPSKQLQYIKNLINSNGISKYSITGINKTKLLQKKNNTFPTQFIEDLNLSDHEVIVEELFE